MPLITCPTLYYLFFWLKTKRSRGFENRILPSYLKEKQNSCCSVAENNETLQMRRRLIKTKHSIFGQGNSKRGHIHSIHPFLFFAIQAPLLLFVFVSLSLCLFLFVCLTCSLLSFLLSRSSHFATLSLYRTCCIPFFVFLSSLSASSCLFVLFSASQNSSNPSCFLLHRSLSLSVALFP